MYLRTDHSSNKTEVEMSFSPYTKTVVSLPIRKSVWQAGYLHHHQKWRRCTTLTTQCGCMDIRGSPINGWIKIIIPGYYTNIKLELYLDAGFLLAHPAVGPMSLCHTVSSVVRLSVCRPQFTETASPPSILDRFRFWLVCLIELATVHRTSALDFWNFEF